MEYSEGYSQIPRSDDGTLGAPPAIRDPMLNAHLIKQGYVKLSGEVIDAPTRSAVRTYFLNEFTGDRSGFHNDFFLPHSQFRRAGAEFIAAVLRTVWSEVFVDFQPFLLSFIAKFGSGDSAFPQHRDWMYVDELAGHRSYILYVAIDDSDGRSGMVHVVPRSHLLPGPPCGTRAYWPWLKRHEVLRDRAEPLQLRAGEAAVWDNRLIHMSYQNRSGFDRVALGAWCHRPNDPLAHFGRYSPTDELIDQYRIAPQFFVEETPEMLLLRPPSESPMVDRLDVRLGRTDAEALLAHLDGLAVEEADDAWTMRRSVPY